MMYHFYNNRYACTYFIMMCFMVGIFEKIIMNENIKREQSIQLRALEVEDLDFLYQIENDASLWEVGNTNVPYSRQVLLDYIANSSADIYADKQVRLIVENEDHVQVGIVDLVNFDPRHLRAELGIVIAPAFQRRGLAQASVKQLLYYAKHVLHLHQVYAIVATNNTKAAQMLQSLGFETDKMLRDWLCKGDEYENAYLFQCFL